MRALIGAARRAWSTVLPSTQLRSELASAEATCEVLRAEAATLAKERDEALAAEKVAQRAASEQFARANTATRAAHVAEEAAAAAVREAQWGGWRAEKAQLLRNNANLEADKIRLERLVDQLRQTLDERAGLVDPELAHA